MKFIVRIIVTALAILLATELLPGIEVDSLTTLILSALLLSVVNVTIKPVLVILTLPITILTLGVFYFILNAFFFSFVATLIDGFEVESLGVALVGSLIVSVVTAVATPKD